MMRKSKLRRVAMVPKVTPQSIIASNWPPIWNRWSSSRGLYAIAKLLVSVCIRCKHSYIFLHCIDVTLSVIALLCNFFGCCSTTEYYNNYWYRETICITYSSHNCIEHYLSDDEYIIRSMYTFNTIHCFYRASICEGGLGSRNSVCLSVCPSVCHTRGLWQN